MRTFVPLMCPFWNPVRMGFTQWLVRIYIKKLESKWPSSWKLSLKSTFFSKIWPFLAANMSFFKPLFGWGPAYVCGNLRTKKEATWSNGFEMKVTCMAIGYFIFWLFTVNAIFCCSLVMAHACIFLS